MSRNLPVRPSLEFLRKEAKALLESMRQRDAARQLADAQYALARDYGFDSWPKLKAHVETLAVSPFSGRWVADVSRSKRHPANLFQQATMVFAVRGNSVDVSNVVVEESGKVVRGRYTFEADGVEYPQTHGISLKAWWRDERTLDTRAVQDGRVVGRGTYSVSEDGRRLTIANDEQVIVLDRVEAQ
jgi:hypothetical protein